MGRLERLLQNYERQVSLAWEEGLAGPQKVWFAVYDKGEERRLRSRLEEFEIATKKHKHGWILCDLTNTFPEWLAKEDNRNDVFQDPDVLNLAIKEFRMHVTARLSEVLNSPEADCRAVVAVYGLGALFGLSTFRVSELIKGVDSAIRGRLLVFFPGVYENNVYRLLDARDGWNYLALPITADEGENR